MQRMYGIEMHVPVGKLPGFYAQVIHKIGDHVNVFDRDDLLFVVESEEDCEQLSTILEKSNMLGDRFELLYVPSSASLEQLQDIGFVSQNDRMYLYADRVSCFSFDLQTGSSQDRWAALEQLKEHVRGEIPGADGQSPLYILDSSMPDLAEGIAKAYQVSLQWLHR